VFLAADRLAVEGLDAFVLCHPRTRIEPRNNRQSVTGIIRHDVCILVFTIRGVSKVRLCPCDTVFADRHAGLPGNVPFVDGHGAVVHEQPIIVSKHGPRAIRRPFPRFVNLDRDTSGDGLMQLHRRVLHPLYQKPIDEQLAP